MVNVSILTLYDTTKVEPRERYTGDFGRTTLTIETDLGTRTTIPSLSKRRFSLIYETSLHLLLPLSDYFCDLT